MLANPFRRRAKTADAQPSKGSGLPAITIATNGQSSRRKGRAGKEAGITSDGATEAANQPPQLRLPPESSYRTSLIMPHLTRRFTLLQAPDGTMVTPDAMRAHLRAQRQRARVEGQPGANFLTEQEEDEIIEQMKRQTRMDADVAEGYQNAATSMASGPRTFQAGGTDGFGGDWASTSRLTSSSPTSPSRSGNYDRLGSLAETLGDLNASSSTNAIASSASSGSLFSGRSSQRDHAYLRSLDKPKVPQVQIRGAEPAIEEEEEAATADEQDPGDSMPGGFASSARTIPAEQEVPRSGLTPPRAPRTPPGSNPSPLLSTLSPEAFRRVSTALEEVISMVAPNQYGALAMGESESSSYEVTGESVGGTDDDGDQEGEASTSEPLQGGMRADGSRLIGSMEQEEREEGEASTSYSSGAGPQHERHYSDATGRTNGSSRTHDEDDEGEGSESLPQTSVRLPRLRRTSAKGKRSHSPDSDTTSFTSAREEANPILQIEHLSVDNDPITSIVDSNLTPSGSLQQELGIALTKSSQTLLGLDGEMTPSASGTNTIVAGNGAEGARTTSDTQIRDSDPEQASEQIIPKTDRGVPTFETPVKRSHTRQGTGDSSRVVHADSARRDKVGDLVASGAPMSPSRPAPLESPTTRFHKERAADGSRGPQSEGRRPLTPGGPSSSLHQPVLSADAIAARSQQRYFPQTPTSLTRAATADLFASGFRKTPSAVEQSTARTLGRDDSDGVPSAYAASSALANVTKDARKGVEVSSPATAVYSSASIADKIIAPSAAKEKPQLDTSRLSVAESAGDSPISPFGSRSDQSEGDDDVWAKVARNLESEEGTFDESSSIRLPYTYEGEAPSSGMREPASGQARDLDPTFGHDSWRPISHLPAQELEATGGVTMSQLAQLQANLVRSASQKQPGRTQLGIAPAVPDIPRRYSSATSTAGSARHSARYDGEELSTPKEPAVNQMGPPLRNQAKSSRTSQQSCDEAGKAETPAKAAPRTPDMNAGSAHGAAPPLQFTSPFQRAAGTAVAMQAQTSSPASQMTKSSSVRSFKSQVMYDVTTSHRPTSPPLRRLSTQGSHRRNNSSLNNLPTLHDLSLRLNGVGSGRESSTGYRPMLDPAIGGISDDEPINIGQALDSQHSAGVSGARDFDGQQQLGQRPESDLDDQQPLSSGGQGVPGYAGLFGLYTPDLTQGDQQSGQFEPIDAYGGYEADASMPFSPDQTLSSEAGEHVQQRALGPPLDVTALSPASAQSGWSGRSGSANSRREVSGDMMQDVALQARAATQALKGPQAVDGKGPHIPPRRSKSLSKKKSRKNPGKIIGPPQLLKTTQSLYHAQPIPEGSEREVSGSPVANRTGGATTPMRPPVPKREASDYSNNPKILPATLFEERQDDRRSSFGDTGDASGVGPMSTLVNPPGLAQSSRMQSATPTDGRQFRSASVPSTPIREKSQNGSFGRLMSRMRSRKGSATNGLSDQQTTVDPYLASSGNGAAGSETSSRLASPINERSTAASRGQSPFGFSGYAMQAAESIPESKSQEDLERRQQALTPTQPLAFNGTRRPSGVSPSASPVQTYTASSREPSPIREFRSQDRLGEASRVATPTSRRTLSPTDERGQARGVASSRNAQRNAPVESPVLIQGGQIGDITSQAISYDETDEPGTSAGPTSLPLQATSPAQEAARPLLPHSDSMRTISGGQTGLTSGRVSTDKDLPSRPASPLSPTVPETAKPKSKRDTVVRRTLIFPGDATFVEEKRKSMASIASKRKSRRHADHLGGPDSKGLMSPTFRSASYASGIPDSPHLSVQKLPNETTGMPTTESKSSLVSQTLFAKSPNLRPPSLAGSNYGSSQGAASSYAGSLYDMYVEGDRHSAEVSAFHYDDYEGSRSSYLPDGVGAEKNHIEVTERADGSIVWQVIAGLGGKERLASIDGNGNRNSRYTGYSGHSRADSQSSQLSFLQRASLEASPNPAGASGPAFMERTFSGLPANRDEDSRSLFSRQRTGKQSSLDQKGLDLPPVPLMPPYNSKGAGAVQAANGPSSTTDGTDDDNEVLLPSGDTRRQERSFDMATPSAGVTRVVYSNDVELEQLLEAMARRTDAAKFHFDPRSRGSASSQRGEGASGLGGAEMQRDDTARQGDYDTIEAEGGARPASDTPDEAARKVEEEIMSILALRGEQGTRTSKEHIYPGSSSSRDTEEEIGTAQRVAHADVEQTVTTPRQSQEGFT